MGSLISHFCLQYNPTPLVYIGYHLCIVPKDTILQTKMADETSQPKFKRIYVRFNAQKVGFLSECKSFIGLDGCHIKHRFGGQILSATAKDDFSNNHGC